MSGFFPLFRVAGDWRRLRPVSCPDLIAIQMQRKRAGTTHVLRLYRLQNGDGPALVMALRDLETYRCPQPVLVTERAEP